MGRRGKRESKASVGRVVVRDKSLRKRFVTWCKAVCSICKEPGRVFASLRAEREMQIKTA